MKHIYLILTAFAFALAMPKANAQQTCTPMIGNLWPQYIIPGDTIEFTYDIFGDSATLSSIWYMDYSFNGQYVGSVVNSLSGVAHIPISPNLPPGGYALTLTTYDYMQNVLCDNTAPVGVNAPMPSTLTILEPFGGEVYQSAATDTVVVYTTEMYGTLHYQLVDSDNVVLVSANAAEVAGNGIIHKYLVTWPNVTMYNARLICQMSINGYVGADTSNAFDISNRGVNGTVYYDYNSNNLQDNGEPGFQGPLFTTGQPSQTQSSNGNYQINFYNAGTYTYNLANVPQYYTVSPTSYTVDLSANNMLTNKNFALQPDLTQGSGFDLSVMVTRNITSAAVAGTTSIFVQNNGPGVSDPTSLVYYYNSAQTTIDFFFPNPLSVLQGVVNYEVPSLSPGQIVQFDMIDVLTVPVGTWITEQAGFNLLADLNPANNQGVYNFMATGGVDPNNIVVSADTIVTPDNVNPPYLYYTVNFQNTGNGNAINIRVADTIAANLDLNTFEVVATSHTATFTANPSRVIEWRFSQIMLPDSTTNEAGSHGQIVYRIKPVASLPVNTVVNSAAHIYFDYNAEVPTNTQPVWIVQPTSIAEHAAPQFSVYPNPTNGAIYIQPNTAIKEKAVVRIFSVDGRLLYNETVTNAPYRVDAKLPSGIYTLQLITDKMVSSQKVVIN